MPPAGRQPGTAAAQRPARATVIKKRAGRAYRYGNTNKGEKLIGRPRGRFTAASPARGPGPEVGERSASPGPGSNQTRGPSGRFRPPRTAAASSAVTPWRGDAPRRAAPGHAGALARPPGRNGPVFSTVRVDAQRPAWWCYTLRSENGHELGGLAGSPLPVSVVLAPAHPLPEQPAAPRADPRRAHQNRQRGPKPHPRCPPPPRAPS
jgi:hypothetical protein